MSDNNKANLEDSNSKKTVKSEKNSKNQGSNNSNETQVKKSYYKPKKDFTELLKSKYVQKWLEGVNSKDSRLSVLHEYVEFTGKTPKQLIEEHAADLKIEGIDQVEIAKKQMHSFFGYLTGDIDEVFKNTLNDKDRPKDMTGNSARQYVYSKIASFYKRCKAPVVFEKNEIPIHIKKGSRDKNWREGTKKVTTSEKKACLKKIRDALSLVRDRAILLCKISSGMDDVDLFKLKYQAFDDGYYPELNVCYIEGQRQKNKQCNFQTFFNSEACNLLNIYFKEREQKGEVITNASDLFVKTRKNDKGEYEPIQRRSFFDALKEATTKLGINNITPKQLRKWFSTESKKNVVKPEDNEIIERMMGHVGQVSQHYQTLFSDPDEFAEYYKANIEFATLLGNGDRKTKELDKDVKDLKTTTDKLIEQLVEKSKLIEQLQKDNKEMNLNFETLIGALEMTNETNAKYYAVIKEMKGWELTKEDKKHILKFEKMNEDAFK